MTPLQTYKDMMSEFKKKFPRLIISINESVVGWRDERVETGGRIMEDFIHTSFIKFLESEIEHWKGEMKNKENSFMTDGDIIHNSAISKVIEHYQKLIEDISK